MFFTDTDSSTFMLEIETDPAIYLLCIHVGNEMYEYVLRTDYPNAKLDVEGFIDPKMFNNNFNNSKEDRWIIGPYMGIGVINLRQRDFVTHFYGFVIFCVHDRILT
jgi:hypothetical protein